jgi:hypothetical protein
MAFDKHPVYNSQGEPVKWYCGTCESWNAYDEVRLSFFNAFNDRNDTLLL